VVVAIVTGVRGLILGRRAKEEKKVEEEEAAEREASAQAEAISIWVEEGDRRGAEVILRNGSPYPIRFVVILIDRVGDPLKRTGEVNQEIVTYRSVGPMRGIRAAVTLTSLGGVVRADARVRFIDYNLQGWERNYKGELHRSDYKPEDFSASTTDYDLVIQRLLNWIEATSGGAAPTPLMGSNRLVVGVFLWETAIPPEYRSSPTT
jgi:hypothetical protein